MNDDVVGRCSYLVCSMYEEAASLASTILNRLRDRATTTTTEEQDMVQSTAMVLVQAFNQLGRTPEILDQLRSYFNSIKAIPPQLLCTGACFQIAQGSTFLVRQFLHEFLNGWSLEDGQYHAVIAEPNVECPTSFHNHFVLGIHDYLEVVEVYAVTLLATVLQDVDLAISWVQNAPLPEENRQGLLRRLHSMHSLKTTISSQVASLQSHTNNSEGSPEALKGKHADDKTYRSKDGVSKLSERIETCFWCFRSINLKFGNAKFVIPSGKIMLGCLILFVCYVFRRKQATLKRIVRRQVNATKRALGDLWQLAFSYEVDPLAAVQPLVAATHQGQ
ncbi:protein APEM9 isoform X2 [Trifolium pratense]|uniref:Uncharacterized protein n=1 Tax=Trifolium pratense TaxID=57577 RepID=A0ACB0L999_TRIPR|nr:protein APEM9 isoform X2 [Trifolium pratense]CAJ2665198.1 unnamed protein product [Trifolium pratense]